MTRLRGSQASRRCGRSHRSAALALPCLRPQAPRVESSTSLEHPGSRGEAFRRWFFASAETVRWFCAVALPDRSPVAVAWSAGAYECQGEKYLPGSSLPPNHGLEGSAQQLRCRVPVALRAPAPPQPER